MYVKDLPFKWRFSGDLLSITHGRKARERLARASTRTTGGRQERVGRDTRRDGAFSFLPLPIPSHPVSAVFVCEPAVGACAYAFIVRFRVRCDLGRACVSGVCSLHAVRERECARWLPSRATSANGGKQRSRMAPRGEGFRPSCKSHLPRMQRCRRCRR